MCTYILNIQYFWFNKKNNFKECGKESFTLKLFKRVHWFFSVQRNNHTAGYLGTIHPSGF